jgi:hypothetical protein
MSATPERTPDVLLGELKRLAQEPEERLALKLILAANEVVERDERIAELEQAVGEALLLCDEAETRPLGNVPLVRAANTGAKVLAERVRARLTGRAKSMSPEMLAEVEKTQDALRARQGESDGEA